MEISVGDLRVNNVLATAAVRLIEPYPTVSWSYELIDRITASDPPASIDVTYKADPAGYEIRLGTTATNFGLNSYVGNLIETDFVETDATSWRYYGSRLIRGYTYYGQIRLTDSLGHTSSWSTFTIRYNSLPTAESAVITPTTPSVHDDLLLSYSFSDADGDVESGSKIWWYKNGIHERQFDGKTIIPAEFLSYQDSWLAKIYPSDGYEIGTFIATSAVSITKEIPTATNIYITPDNPTYNDPLYAKYEFSSTGGADESLIRWYVNGVQQSQDTAFARLDVEEGDVVHFEVMPNDGEVAGSWVASENVTITKPPFRVVDLKVDQSKEPLSLSSLTPAISWSFDGPSTLPTVASIKIGTGPLSDNVLSAEITSSLGVFAVPENMLQEGSDYYVSVATGDDDGLGEYAVAHFRTVGSRWKNAVSNSTGWTVETTVLLEAVSVSSSSSSSSSESSSSMTASGDDYQGIQIYDGTKFAEVRLFVDKVVLVSTTSLFAAADLSDYSVITITGVGSDVKVYKDYVLLIDGTGLLTSATTNAFIEFGSIGSSSIVARYLNFQYTTAGAFEPASSEQYYDIQFDTFFEFDGNVDFVAGLNGSAYFATSNETDDESATIYKISDNVSPVKLNPISASYVGVNKIAVSNDYTYVCHDKGATSLTGYVVPAFDVNLDFAGGDDPQDANFSITASNILPTNSSGLVINTVPDGQLYYSQNNKGTIWFDRVSNDAGWTIEFSLRVDQIVDDSQVANSSLPDGIGVYVNDGKFQENIQFFENFIVFTNANTSIDYDATALSEYRLTGKGGELKLYAKADNQTYALIASSRFQTKATSEANGNRPAIAEDADGHQHAVWHDDGLAYRRIYYAFGDNVDGSIVWETPTIIVDEKHGAANPDIAIDSTGTIYVVYESSKSDSTDIGIVVKSRFGWSKPFTLSSELYEARAPKIVIDSSDRANVVWEDHREIVGQIYFNRRDKASGRWSGDIKVTNEPYGCQRPSLSVVDDILFMSYTVRNEQGFSNIYVNRAEGGGFQTPVPLTTNGIDADFSDIAVEGSTVYVVWHDNQSDDYDIYARRLNTSLAYVGATVKLTDDLISSRFPVIGIKKGADANTGNAYVVWESGGDLYPYDADDYSPTNTHIKVALYNLSLGGWLSSNQTVAVGMTTYGGEDVLIIADDLRASRRPAIAKTFANNTHILYETDIATADDEYLLHSDTFTSIRDAVYDQSYSSTYSISDSTLDLKVSGRELRKELRFGDYSDSRSVNCTFGFFRLYAGDAVRPYLGTLVDSDKKVNGVAVGGDGDAWLATDAGLDFYFRRHNEVAHFSELYGMLATDVIRDVAFDNNNIMYVASEHGVYVSHDHRNMHAAFSFLPDDIRSLAFDRKNNLWVATGSGVYKVQTLAETVDLPREGTYIIDSYTSSSSSSSTSSSSSGSGSATGNEIKIVHIANVSLYCFIINPSGKIWNGTTFQTINSANWSSYAVSLTAQNIPNLYYADFPTAITTPAIYTILLYEKAGSTPVSSDTPVGQGEVQWDGIKEVQPGESSTSGGSGSGSTGSDVPGDADGDGETDDSFVYQYGDTGLGYRIFNTSGGLPSNNCTKIYVDAGDQVWIATDVGLVQIRSNFVSLFNIRNSGLPSNVVKDIAIRNNGLRYLATSGGLAKMTGTLIEKIGINSTDWSDNLTAVAWKAPNIIWAGGGSHLYQIVVDDVVESYTPYSFTASEFANFVATGCVDFSRFSFENIDTNSLVQVLVNGRLVKNGYRVLGGQLAFDSQLKSSDQVEVLVRKDITRFASLVQNRAEAIKNGVEYRGAKKFAMKGTKLAVITEGDKDQLVIYDAADIFNMPYDKIVLDTTPPEGTLVYESQRTRRLVNMRIDDAIDNLSGLQDMIVSNYPNLTSDGSTPLSWIPYKEKFVHDLGSDLGNVFTEKTISGTSGRRVVSFKNTFFAGCASPAKIYRYSSDTTAWTEVATIDSGVADTSVEFMSAYKGALVVGTGSATAGGKIWISGNGVDFTLLTTITGTHARCAAPLDDVLYIGTGPNGKIYSYDGANVRDVFTGLGSTIYSLVGAKKFLYVGTGEQARVYKFDPITEVAQILYVDSDTRVTALGASLIQQTTPSATEPADDSYVFAGMGNKGRLVKSVNGQPFTVSFSTIASKVSQIKPDNNGLLHAIVGKTIYKYQGKSWQARYTNSEAIEDVAFDQKGMTIISSSAIKRVNNEITKKKIYLALRDVAGNASSDLAAISTEIEIEDLLDFTNTNRLVELDEYGDEVFVYDGAEPFFSGNKITVEEGVYYSEVFNGTNDHVAWDIIYWDAAVPEDTDLKMYVRVGSSRSEILTNTFDKTFSKEDFEGGDISTLSGQFIQFKVVMTTTVRNKSPKLYRVNIRSKSRSSVHFFTTNFVLPSAVTKGLITAEAFVPFAGDIIVGYNTNDSVDFSEYQIVELDRIFTADADQIGENLRIGVKLISPLNFTVQTDDNLEYSPYATELYNNVIDFEFTAPADGTYNFKAELYEDYGLTNLASTVFSGTSPTAFSVDYAAFPDEGVTLETGDTVRILMAVKGNAAIRCNEYYYLKLYSAIGSTFTLLEEDKAFIANCNPTDADVVTFDFTNTGATDSFAFRVKAYSDAARTTLVENFFSVDDHTAWTINDGLMPEGGLATIDTGDTVSVSLTPTSLSGDAATIYYLSIDVYDDGAFRNITNSRFVRVSPSISFSCGEYTDVPVLKNIAIMFDIEEFEESFGSRKRLRRTHTLNI